MLTPEELRAIAESEYLELYRAFEQSILDAVVERLVRVGFSETSRYQLERLAAAGAIQQDVLARLPGLDRQATDALMALFEEAAVRSIGRDAVYYEQAGISPILLGQSPAMMQVLRAGYIKTQGEMAALTRTTALTTQAAFLRHTDLAYMQVTSGAMTAGQALRQAVRHMADDGLYVLYPSGHRDKIDVAARRAVLTGVNQTCAEITLETMRELDADYVETTAHLGARPTHEPWQGQVFQVSTGEFVAATDYGSVTGLCGANCRHNFHPFFPGISTRSYGDSTVKRMNRATVPYDGEDVPMYDATQRQREMERDIRKAKRELNAYTAASNAGYGEDAFLAALREEYALDALKLKQLRDRLRDFERQTGLYSQTERQQVHGFGRSAASKAVWAARKEK